MNNTINLSNFTGYGGYLNAQVLTHMPPDPVFYRQFYQLVKAYSANNGLYTFINEVLQTTRISNKSVKPLRNPANRVVEFYGAKLWPGSNLRTTFPIVTKNEKIVDPIYQVWGWSNFASKKQLVARQFAITGDMFIKIETVNKSQVYQRFIDPEYVTEFTTDNRGFITYIRLDIPTVTRLDIQSTDLQQRVHTEVWDKETQSVTIWNHKQGLNVALDKINETPTTSGNINKMFGVDFIPFVYQPFREDGLGRANGAYVHTLDKIDEINIKATRLSQMLFRYGKADKKLTSDVVDSSGRPLPAPNIGNLKSDSTTITINGEEFFVLPSGWDIDNLIANIDFKSHLEAIEDDIEELQQDLPELLYSKVAEGSNLSGVALNTMLEPAKARLLESQGNGENAFIRANKMSLTIGQNLGIFKDLGTFESGALDHQFKKRPFIIPSPLEVAQTAGTYVGLGANLIESLIEAGATPERAKQLAQIEIFGTDEVPR